MPIAARCGWVVTAGLVPGEPPDEKYFRRFDIDSKEWEDEARRDALFSDRGGAAHAWALLLENLAASGRDVNWVRVEFFWY